MEVGLDNFGRVLIPKELRDHLGWKAGMRLEATATGDGLLLHLEEEESPLQSRGQMLVFCGDLEADPDQVLRQVREGRLQRFADL